MKKYKKQTTEAMLIAENILSCLDYRALVADIAKNLGPGEIYSVRKTALTLSKSALHCILCLNLSRHSNKDNKGLEKSMVINQ